MEYFLMNPSDQIIVRPIWAIFNRVLVPLQFRTFIKHVSLK